MFVILAKKLGSRVALEDVPPIPQRGHLSGADIEGMVGRAWRTSLLAGADHVTREALAEVVAAVHAVDAGARARAAGDGGDARVHRPAVSAAGDPREDGGVTGGRAQLQAAAHRAQTDRRRELCSGGLPMARTSWFDDKAEHPVIQERVEKLESFTSALADGVVSKQELAGQEQRLVAAMKTARGRAERRAAREGHDAARRADGLQRHAAAARAAGRARAHGVRQSLKPSVPRHLAV